MNFRTKRYVRTVLIFVVRFLAGSPLIAALDLSGRQVQLLQERGKSRVVVQALQQGVHFRKHQTGITLGISSVQPLERFVGLVPESINLGDLERITCMVFRQLIPAMRRPTPFPDQARNT